MTLVVTSPDALPLRYRAQLFEGRLVKFNPDSFSFIQRIFLDNFLLCLIASDL